MACVVTTASPELCRREGIAQSVYYTWSEA